MLQSMALKLAKMTEFSVRERIEMILLRML